MQKETEKTAGQAGAYDRKHRIIVTNMPFNITEEDTLKHFRGAVGIEKHKKNGVETGAVFIQCTSSTDVNRFIKTFDKTDLNGREIKVSQLHDKEVFKAKKKFEGMADENARGREKRIEFENAQKRKLPEGEEERTLFITNISFKDTEEEIIDAFSPYGEVEQCTLVVNKETGSPTGRAFILYKNKESCKDALKNQISLNKRVLIVLKYVSPEALRQKEEEKKEKQHQTEKTIKDRKAGRLEPRDPSKLSNCRVHLSHIDKGHTRKSVSKAIEEYFLSKHDKKVKLRGINLTSNTAKKNPGYCFVTFKFPEDAEVFIQEQKRLHRGLGMKMTAEYAMESKEFLEKGIKKKPSKIDRIEKRHRKEAARRN